MMRQFPIIFIPPEVQRIAQSKPNAPEFNVDIPRVPSYRQPKPIHIQEVLGITIGLILVVAVVTAIAKELGIILLIVGTGAIIIRVKIQFDTYKSRYQRYQDVIQRYLMKFEAYSRQEIKYQSELAIAHSPERIIKFRHQKYRNFFAKLSISDNAIALKDISNTINQQLSDDQTITRGIHYFGITTQKYLVGTFYQGMKLFIPSIDYDWSPDLVYQDPVLNLHIAIEISLSSENAAIMTRNDLAERFLVNSGWIIIKFSQEQILQNSMECCKEFAKLLDRLSFDQHVLSKFADTPDLAPVKLL